jgi:pilus assembly protein CpaE
MKVTSSELAERSYKELPPNVLAAKTLQPRHDIVRQNFIGFAADSETLEMIRTALAPSFPLGLVLHRANFREAINVLRNIATPETVLIDLSGEEQPLTAMVDLEAVVDPGTRLLALGSRRDVGFYRSLTRSLGVKEYLPKPVTAEIIARDFLPWALGLPPKQDAQRGGTIITVSGTRGGIGASTIAVNLAWVIGAELRRHTILLDTDLHTGSAALMLGSQPSSGLRTALEAPDRIDPLLIERAAQPVAERLHVLAAEEPLTEKWSYAPGAAAAMEATLRQRYNFIIVDIPLRPFGFASEMQAIAHHAIFVLDPSLIAARNLKYRLAAPMDPTRNFRPILVVNHTGRSQRSSKSVLEKEVGLSITSMLPDLPQQALKSANFGEILAVKNKKFRSEIVAIAHAVGAMADGDAGQ